MLRNPLPEQVSALDTPSYFPSFQREMNRLINQFRNGFPMPETTAGAALFPAIDVVESDDAIEVSAEVPGVSEKDLDASISGDVLTLKGQKSSEHTQTEDNYHRVERQYGSFRRQIPLGFTPSSGAVEATYADGVLKLRIAKPPAVKADIQKIDISKS
ncbi:MAG: Hsp20/alpha crystallin family protein [Roseovarius sp.]